MDEVICPRLPRQSGAGQGFKLVSQHLLDHSSFCGRSLLWLKCKNSCRKNYSFLYFLSLFEVVVSGNHMKCYAWVTWWRSFSVAEGHHSLLSPFWLFFSPSKYRQAWCVGDHRTSYMFIGSWSLLPFRVRLFSPPDIVSAWWPQAVSASLPQQVTSLQFLLWPHSLPVLPLGRRGGENTFKPTGNMADVLALLCVRS